jgi:hypothetical protein
MKVYDPRRADDRCIEDKALGLLFSMDDAAADNLHQTLLRMSQGKGAGAGRAKMFLGAKSEP